MHTKESKKEIIQGRAVSRGIGIGKVLSLHGKKRQFYRLQISKEKIEEEIRRFRESVRLAKRQLRLISDADKDSVGENQSSIFETHLLFLEDRSLIKKIETTINDEKVNAEWAVKTVTDSYISRYKLLSDKHLREKYIDLEDVAERLLTALGGGKRSEVSMNENTIIAAKEINPSTLIELSQNNPQAIITENGGWTSHSFILARELGIPAVTGLKGILRRVAAGTDVVVDGFLGQVRLNPSEKEIKSVNEERSRHLESVSAKSEDYSGPIKTLDGIEVTIRANLDFSGGYEKSKKMGAKGVGLYRSEFLFNQNKGLPSEDEQFESYSMIADLVGGDGVLIRTFDLGVDQLVARNIEKEKNPALGLRAIRLGLRNENQFRSQIRALLRASHGRSIGIILPMISDASEIVSARRIIEDEREKLKSDGIEIGDPKLGAMIEVPSAVLAVETILPLVDFVNLGTNDLVQYLLAVDRDNEEVAEWFKTLHPSILKAIKIVLEASNDAGVPVVVCGEMAGSPLYTPILIGLGASELSMNLNSIPRVRRIVSNIAREEARKVVSELESCQTAEKVESKARERFLELWGGLFEPGSSPNIIG